MFRSQMDRERFLSYLESAVVRYGALIHAWCLMSNHYHLLVETPRGNLSQIMRHVNGAYTTYFNVKRKRSGHLFQGRFKAILVDADEYAVELSRYIHLNPVRAGIVTKPEQYQWSSYRNYIGQSKTPDWQKTDFIFAFFGKTSREELEVKYQKFIEDILGIEYVSPLEATIASTILGSEEFVREVSKNHMGGRSAERDVPAVKLLISSPSLDEIVRTVKMELGENGDLTRKLSIFFCQKYSGAKLKKIGEYFGISDAAVSQTKRRLELKAREDHQLKMVISKLEVVLDGVRC